MNRAQTLDTINKDTFWIFIDNYWWELIYKNHEFRAENVLGGGFALDYQKEEEILKNYNVVKANNRNELDWSNTSVLNNKSILGWLDPQGNFYGCDYQEHVYQARYVHNSSEELLEENGWIKLTFYENDRLKPLLLMSHKKWPTKKQLDYLSETVYANTRRFKRYLEGR